MASGGSKAGSGRGRRVIIVLALLTAFGSVVAFVAPRLVPSARVGDVQAVFRYSSIEVSDSVSYPVGFPALYILPGRLYG